MATIKPLPGYVLIEPIEDEEKSVGGVYLPETSKDKPSKGKVIAVSEPFTDFNISFQTPFVHSPVKVGQVIYHKKWTNETVSTNGKEYLFVKFEDLLGVQNE